MCSGPESKWGSVSDVPSVSSGIAPSFALGLRWLFPGDFQPELQGSQAPARAHMESRDACISCMTFSVQQEVDEGRPETELVWPWASLFTPLSISVATEALSNLCS